MDRAVHDRWLAAARERVREAGLRRGAARSRVIDLMARDGQCLIDAQTIVERLQAQGASGSQASVYRVLDELHGLGLITRTIDASGVAQYEIHDHHSHHHHFVDLDTGAVEPFHDPDLERALERAARRLGVEMSEHDIVLRGRRVR